MPKNHRGEEVAGNYIDAWRDAHAHKCPHCGQNTGTGRNEVASTLADYEHWNEEAPIAKAREDRYTDYYNDQPYETEDWDD